MAIGMRRHLPFYIAASVLTSGLNYATYPLLGRILPASQFVHITVSLSLFTQISTFLASIVALTVGITKAAETSNNAAGIMEYLQSRLMRLFFYLSLIFLLLSPLLLPITKLPIFFALPIVMLLLVSLPSATTAGYLTGKSNFIRLGYLILAGGILQLVFAVAVAAITKNGALALTFMALGQLAAVLYVYYGLNKHERPPLALTRTNNSTDVVPGLMRYAIFSSFAVMVINLAQVADLLMVQNLATADIKFYADIYIISRIVFFAGMIFVWPFLSEINILNLRKNLWPFSKILAYFSIITAGAILCLVIFGSHITTLLFNSSYSSELVRNVGVLSVLFKFWLLIITATVLYFVVLRSYLAVWIALAVSTLMIGYGVAIGHNASITNLLLGLNAIAATTVIVCGFLVARFRAKSISTN